MQPNTKREPRVSVIDGVLSSQPELGPKTPDGGYGWVVFTATLFFQIFIPSLIVVHGLFIALAKLNQDINSDQTLQLWDDKLIHVPLMFVTSWTIFDPFARKIISQSTWPRLIGEGGTCLTCAGLLFVWMGMASYKASLISDKALLILAGLFTGIGSSIQVAQCEIFLAQYFKLKHQCLSLVSQATAAIGFIVVPCIVAQLRMKYSLLKVVLIYQAILLVGLVINIAFKKPEYLKNKLIRYHYVTENVEDEEDIFSKSLTELKVKTKDVLERIEIKNNKILNIPSTSSAGEESKEIETKKKNWIKFDNDDQRSAAKNWEKFDEQNDTKIEESQTSSEKYVVLGDFNSVPTPLFNESRVNMNNTYAFDDNIESNGTIIPNVFCDTENNSKTNLSSYWSILKTPTFYKSLLTVITTKYSFFIFYALFPSYLYVQVNSLKFKKTALLVGSVSLSALIFSIMSYWLNITKQRRPMFLFMLCWIGANGYFLIAMYRHDEYFVIFGGLEVVLSIASLQQTGGDLLGLTIRGESNSEHTVLCLLSGLSFSVFFFIDLSYKNCFLLMALLHVITGLSWVTNYFYKKLKLYRIL